MKKVIIIGASGHGKVIADIIKLSGDQVIGFLDDKSPSELPGFCILGTTADIGTIKCWHFVAIGDCKLREKMMQYEAKWYTAIHPTAVIAEGVVIGRGSCVMANAVVNTGSKIGKGVIVNTAATVDHDCTISDFVHIAPGVHLSGTVTVGSKTWIGVGSSISNNINICGDCIIGAGTVVIKDIEEPGTYVGVPAFKKCKDIR
jgi:sugar O-acyltransferase (sialic acid O-acetyltransferase NeuD family)